MTGVPSSVFEAIDATWPPVQMIRHGNWMLREGGGGGKRVSAATRVGDVTARDIDDAEAAMRALQQPPLFMVRDGDDYLDTALHARGYQIVDPVVVLRAPVITLTNVPVPPVSCFAVWEPLEIMKEIWAQGGIGPARLAVMHRAETKTAIFGRCENRPAGCGFVAVSGKIAMVHAVEVLPALRRKGVAGWIMRHASVWAQEHGAEDIVVLCTRANTAALALYSGLGFETVAGYHYRQHP